MADVECAARGWAQRVEAGRGVDERVGRTRGLGFRSAGVVPGVAAGGLSAAKSIIADTDGFRVAPLLRTIMRKSVPAADPDAYIRGLEGWRRKCVEMLRAAVRKSTALEETIKWGHLVYAANGPVLLIRAEDARVLFGFWRGQRLREIEPRLKPGGKYEMATLEIREGETIKPAVVARLAREATALKRTLGDPTKIAKARSGRRVAKAVRTARS